MYVDDISNLKRFSSLARKKSLQQRRNVIQELDCGRDWIVAIQKDTLNFVLKMHEI